MALLVVSCKKDDFSLNSGYKRIMGHRGLKFGIFIPVGCTGLAKFSEFIACWKLHCCMLIWCGFINFADIYTLCVLS